MSQVLIIGDPGGSLAEALLRLLEAGQVERVSEFELRAPPELVSEYPAFAELPPAGQHRPAPSARQGQESLQGLAITGQ